MEKYIDSEIKPPMPNVLLLCKFASSFEGHMPYNWEFHAKTNQEKAFCFDFGTGEWIPDSKAIVYK